MNGIEECSLASLDLGSKLPVQTAISKTQYCKAVVSKTTLGGDLFSITIPSSNEDYIDMSQFKLYVKFKVLSEINAPIDINSNVGTANNLIHSMFKNIQVLLGDTVVSSDGNLYAYKAYIENQFGHNKEYKECVLYGDGMRKDSDLENQNIKYSPKTEQAAEVKVNPGFVERHELISKGLVELCGNLHLDISSADKFLVNNIGLTFNLRRNDAAFVLKGAKGSKIHYENIEVFYRSCKIASNIRESNALLMDSGYINYPIKRIQMTASTATISSKLWSINISSNIIPNRVLFTAVDQAAFIGSYNLNPFNFKHYNIKKMALKMNNVYYCYTADIVTDFPNNNYHEAYSTLFQGIKDAPNDISYKNDYKSGNFLVAYILSPDLCSNLTHTNAIQTGQITLEIELEDAIESSVTAIIYAEYDNLIQINKKSIQMDYS